jgi:hypothetical protein
MHTSFLRRAADALAAAFAALALAACGGHDYSTPGAPTIASFTATPAALAAGGGTVQLSWSSADATTLSIDNGVGDVSGITSKSVTVSAGTTFTLTATNAVGTASASTSVTVAAATAPTISSFMATPATLPLGGGSVTLSWATAGSTSLSIDNGVGDVTGLTSKAVNVAADTTFTLTATNATGSVTRTTAVVLASANSLFFDPVNGLDANPCTAVAPCRTLTRQLALAPPGTTFSLADGMYSATSEGHPTLTIPDGAIVQAIHPGQATLASMAVLLAGSATLSGIAIGPEGPNATYCGAIGAGSANFILPPNPTLTLIGVSSNCVGFLSIGGGVKATMTPGALPGGVYTTGLNGVGSPLAGRTWVSIGGGAELLVQGGVIEGSNTGNTGGADQGVFNAFQAQLTLDGVTLRNWAESAFEASNASLTLRNGTVIDHVGDSTNPAGCAVKTGSYSSSLTMDHATLSNVSGIGICVESNGNTTETEAISLTQSTITNATGAAIQDIGGLGTGSVAITADGLGLVGNAYGLYWTARAGSIDIRNSSITGSTATTAGAGLFFNPQHAAGLSFKLRNSTVSNNAQDGALFSQFENSTIDLGTTADPGGNTLTGNGTTGLHIDALGGAGTINAVGNTWIANQQGADAVGHYSVAPAYTRVPKTGAASGANYKIENAVSTLDL